MLMTRPFLWLSLVFIWSTASSGARAQERADSAALVRITQALMHAVTDGKPAVWAARLSSRWFITDEEGAHITRSQFLKGLQGRPPGQSGKLQVMNARFVDAPGVAVLSYDIDEWHDYHGQELRTRFHSTDTWVRERSGWKMLTSQVTALPRPIEGRAVARAILDAYAGTYELTPEIRLRIVATDTGLALERDGRPTDRLHAIDERIFIRHGARGFWLFERDSKGAIVRLVSWRDNNPVIWRRVR